MLNDNLVNGIHLGVCSGRCGAQAKCPFLYPHLPQLFSELLTAECSQVSASPEIAFWLKEVRLYHFPRGSPYLTTV